MLYLIHFDRPLHHARHYLGYSDEARVRMRMLVHRSGRGAKLLAALRKASIDWAVVRTMEGDRKRERQLKNRHNSPRLCPVCCGRVAWPLSADDYLKLGLPDALNPTISAADIVEKTRRRAAEEWQKYRSALPPACSREEQLAQKAAAMLKSRERAARRQARRRAAWDAKVHRRATAG
jgi:hypothetical protein